MNSSDYFYKKIIESFLYGFEIKGEILKGEYNKYLFKTSFLNYIEKYTKNVIKNNLLPNNKLKRLKQLLCFISSSNVFDNNRQEFHEIHRNLLIISNNEIKKEEFIIKEINKRLDITELDEELYNKYAMIVNQSIDFDLPILIYFTKEKTDSDFKRNITKFQRNKYFFYSLNAIIKEYPNILNDNNFYIRLNKIIERNSLCKNYRLKKDEIEKIDKILKKLNIETKITL